ncbi:SDR family NAD(P)-dependent oxidoreductase [Novosphingobium colocasiae]|uniref:SDR family NAD(P)-dependent oxidoreductase n=1 Tax=Novosphingobium colocasiae TaxID=1256513 RepID=UPI0035B221B1
MTVPLVDLGGMHIVLVGGGGDIGTAMARQFVELGAQLRVFDRDAAALDRLRETLGAPAQVEVRVVDVTDEVSMRAAFAAAGERIDGLVNAAGIENPPMPIEDFDLAMFRKVMDVNVTGVFLGLKYGVPRMAGAGGSIVNLGSTGGIKGAALVSAYVASKHAVIGLTRSAAVECGPRGIRVNAVCPGPIEGRMIDAIYGSSPGQPSEQARARMAQMPSRRFGRADEVAGLTAFLLSPASGFINGALYSIDGGISAI